MDFYKFGGYNYNLEPMWLHQSGWWPCGFRPPRQPGHFARAWAGNTSAGLATSQGPEPPQQALAWPHGKGQTNVFSAGLATWQGPEPAPAPFCIVVAFLFLGIEIKKLYTIKKTMRRFYGWNHAKERQSRKGIRTWRKRENPYSWSSLRGAISLFVNPAPGELVRTRDAATSLDPFKYCSSSWGAGLDLFCGLVGFFCGLVGEWACGIVGLFLWARGLVLVGLFCGMRENGKSAPWKWVLGAWVPINACSPLFVRGSHCRPPSGGFESSFF